MRRVEIDGQFRSSEPTNCNSSVRARRSSCSPEPTAANPLARVLRGCANSSASAVERPLKRDSFRRVIDEIDDEPVAGLEVNFLVV